MIKGQGQRNFEAQGPNVCAKLGGGHSLEEQRGLSFPVIVEVDLKN